MVVPPRKLFKCGTPILKLVFACSLVAQAQRSYQAQMQLSTMYTSIALLKLTLAMWDNTRYCYMGSLHEVSALEITKLKFNQILSLVILTNISTTQYNPIVKALFDCRKSRHFL